MVLGYHHACPRTRTGVGLTRPVAGVPGGPMARTCHFHQMELRDATGVCGVPRAGLSPPWSPTLWQIAGGSSFRRGGCRVSCHVPRGDVAHLAALVMEQAAGQEFFPWESPRVPPQVTSGVVNSNPLCFRRSRSPGWLAALTGSIFC